MSDLGALALALLGIHGSMADTIERRGRTGCAPVPAGSGAPSATDGPDAPRCIGLVEGDDLVRRAWRQTLQSCGYDVMEAADGVGMLAQLEDRRPALIVLDILMPRVGGFEFLARLRSDPRWSDVPVLILSELADALGCAVDPQSARDLGIVGIVPKTGTCLVFADVIAAHAGPPRGVPDARLDEPST